MYSYGDILFYFYLLEIVIGVLGNGFLLCLHTFHIISSHKTRSIDLIIINLTFSNTLMILIRGVPWAIQSLQSKIVLDDIGCKILIYLQRVSWNSSLCSTCLLSVFQVITISSRSTRWKELKLRAPKYIIPFCILLWFPILLLSVIVFFHENGARNSTNSKQSKNLWVCSLNRYVKVASKFLIRKSLHEAIFVVFIVISSGYMIFVLYRHHQQVWHNLGTTLSPRSSPEIRATKIILLMVSIFLYFYSVSFIFIIYVDNSHDIKQWMPHVSVLLTLCYPTFIPYVLISSDSQISNSCYVLQWMKNSCLYPPTSQTKQRRVLFKAGNLMSCM